MNRTGLSRCGYASLAAAIMRMHCTSCITDRARSSPWSRSLSASTSCCNQTIELAMARQDTRAWPDLAGRRWNHTGGRHCQLLLRDRSRRGCERAYRPQGFQCFADGVATGLANPRMPEQRRRRLPPAMRRSGPFDQPGPREIFACRDFTGSVDSRASRACCNIGLLHCLTDYQFNAGRFDRPPC